MFVFPMALQACHQVLNGLNFHNSRMYGFLCTILQTYRTPERLDFHIIFTWIGVSVEEHCAGIFRILWFLNINIKEYEMKDQKSDKIQRCGLTLFKSLELLCGTLLILYHLNFPFFFFFFRFGKLITFQTNIFSETPQILI